MCRDLAIRLSWICYHIAVASDIQVYASAGAVQRVLRLLSEGTYIDTRTKGISGLLVTYNAAAEAFGIARLGLSRGLHVRPFLQSEAMPSPSVRQLVLCCSRHDCLSREQQAVSAWCSE